jgi:hypothetical protein
MPVQTTLVKTISGGYTAMYNGSNIGRTRDGATIHKTIHFEPVHTDDYADSPADGVARGISFMVTLDYAEYGLIKAALDVAEGTEGLASLNVGLLASALAQQLVLTAVPGTPAATLDGANKYFFDLAIVQDDVSWILANHPRQGPIRFMAYPNSLGQCYRYATS